MGIAKLISPKGDSFEANGKTYHVESSLSIERYVMFLKLELEFGYNIGFAGIYKEVTRAIGELNKTNFVDSAVILTKILEGAGNLDNKYVPAVNICGLFFNTKDEDRTKITDELLKQKQSDWEAAGIEASFFLNTAADLVKGYRKTSPQSSQTTLKKANPEKKNPS